MKNIALGRYIPYDTIIHRMDPRTKLLLMIAMLVAVFFPLTYWEYAVLILVTLVMVAIAKLSILSIFRSLKPMWVMMIFLMIINVIVVKTGDPLFTIGKFTMYSGSLLQTLNIVFRLFLMISLTTILTSTTKPLELTYAIEFYFAPLKVVKFPSHEIAMTISIALRFIPTLLEETEKIMKAQASRGIDMVSGKLKEKISGVLSLIIPLFISSFQRSEELANAMEARGYNPSGKRTRYRKLNFHLCDLIATIICAVIVFAVIYSVYNPQIVQSLEFWR